jgi:hypothetical protein
VMFMGVLWMGAGCLKGKYDILSNECFVWK